MLEFLANIGKDKLLHSFYGALIYALVSVFSVYIALCVVVLVAVGKEVYDYKDYGKFDIKDVMFTVMIPILLVLVELVK